MLTKERYAEILKLIDGDDTGRGASIGQLQSLGHAIEIRIEQVERMSGFVRSAKRIVDHV